MGDSLSHLDDLLFLSIMLLNLGYGILTFM